MDEIFHTIAAATPGSTVTLPPGTHTTSVVIDKSVVVKGSSPGTTLIAAAGGVPVLTIRAQRVIISDLALHQPEAGIAAVRIDEDAYPQLRRVQVTGGPIVGNCSLADSSAPRPIAALTTKRKSFQLPAKLGPFAVIAAIGLLALGAIAWVVDSKPAARVVPSSIVTISESVEPAAPRPIPVLAEIAGDYSCTEYRDGVVYVYVLQLQPAGKGTFSYRFDRAGLPRGITSYDAATGRISFDTLGAGRATVGANGKVIIRSERDDGRNSWHFDRDGSAHSSEVLDEPAGNA